MSGSANPHLPSPSTLVVAQQAAQVVRPGFSAHPALAVTLGFPPPIFEAHPPLLFNICEAAILLSLRIEVGFLRGWLRRLLSRKYNTKFNPAFSV